MSSSPKIATWPWAAQSFLNPARAIVDFSDFNYQIYTLLAGRTYTMGDVPRWYVPAYLAIRLPLIMLAGLGLALLFAAVSGLARRTMEPRTRREIGFLAVTVTFPVLCHVIEH